MFLVVATFRLGGLVKFISYPVLAGFTSAAGKEEWEEEEEEDVRRS